MKMEEDLVVGESVGGAVVDINGEVMWDGQVVVHGQSEQVGGCKLLSKRRNLSKKKCCSNEIMIKPLTIINIGALLNVLIDFLKGLKKFNLDICKFR